MRASAQISRKQEQAILTLLAYPSILEAAQQCGVSEATLHRWLKQDAFQMAYRESRRAIVQQAMVQTQQATGTAVATLLAVMQDGTAPASARVTAAKAILEMAIKAVELEDLAVRIAALEATQSQRT